MTVLQLEVIHCRRPSPTTAGHVCASGAYRTFTKGNYMMLSTDFKGLKILSMFSNHHRIKLEINDKISRNVLNIWKLNITFLNNPWGKEEITRKWFQLNNRNHLKNLEITTLEGYL